MYRALINVPGYLPQDDEDHLFDTAGKAWQWLYEQRFEDLDDPMNDEDMVDDGALDEMQGMIEEGVMGVVYGHTPGSHSDHDLGLVYSVIEVTHSNYPHESGRLYDCPACEAECFCTGLQGHMQCVFCALSGEERDPG